MSRFGQVIALLAASSFGCVSARVEGPPTGAAATEPSGPATPAPRIGLAGPATPTQGSSGAIASAAGLTAGKSHAEVSGCAAASGEAESQKFVTTTRGISPPPTVQAIRGGALVDHPLDHTCCLSVAVSSKVEGGTVIIRETLSGSPCRCRCSSDIKTTVGLEPGNWRIAIEVEDAQGPHQVYEQSIEVL